MKSSAFARIDMILHNPSSHEECLKLDPTSIFNDQMTRLRILQNLEPSDRGHPQTTWHHPLSGMDAGYYSYLRYVELMKRFSLSSGVGREDKSVLLSILLYSSAVVAADIFQNTFSEDPRNPETWERYRKAILEHGGSRDELKMVTDFLGHAPDPQYLARSLEC